MNRIIIYGSVYGTSKKYALELANRLNVEAISYEDIKNINDYDSIIYLGGLYAGGVAGMVKTFKKINDIKNKELIVITVGLSDPYNEKNINKIDKSIKNQLKDELFNLIKIYHLRGGIDYSKLGFMHKTMMKMLYNKAQKVPEEERDAEISAMVDTYNKKVDFVDFNELERIIKGIS